MPAATNSRDWNPDGFASLLKTRGVSFEQVGVATGRTAQTIRAYAAGKITPPIGVAATIADALGVDLNILLSAGRELVSDAA